MGHVSRETTNRFVKGKMLQANKHNFKNFNPTCNQRLKQF